MNFQNQYRPSGFGGLPVVTKNIIIINVIMYVATVMLKNTPTDLTRFFGLHYYLASDFKPHQFVTYIFMHDDKDPRHLLFNMLGVFIFGQALEIVWGPKRYLIFYIVTGLGAALTQYVIMHFEISEVLRIVNDEIASQRLGTAEKSQLIDQKFDYLNRHVIVGASGSLFGLLGASGLLFPNKEIYIFLFPIKIKWLVIFYGVSELVSGIENNAADNVAHFAHIGGLLVGVVLVLIWRKDRSHFY